MTRLIRKWGREKANFYATVSTFISVLIVLASIFAYIWKDAKYKSDTQHDIKNMAVQVKSLDSTMKILSDSIYNYNGKLSDLRENDKWLDTKKQDKKNISPSSIRISYLNLGPKRDTSINYLTFIK